MPQIINDPFAGSGGAGASFGTGIARGLENLAQLRLEEMSYAKQQQRKLAADKLAIEKESNALEAFGLPKHISQSIAALGDKDLKNNILSNLGGLGLKIPGLEGNEVANIFESPTAKANREKLNLARETEARKAGEFEKTEARKALETQAKIAESGAKAGLAKAKTADIAENRALAKKNQQLRESIAKVNEKIANEKNDIARQKLEDQRNKMESLITINTNNIEKLNTANQKQQLAQQKAIDTKLKPYRTNLDKRYTASESILSKANQMLDLLNTGEVGSGISGKFTPLFLSSDATNQFSGLADDVANELANLSTGQQTISKIKFNQQRKPNTAQSTATQIERTQDLIKEANKVVLENDIANYFIEQNGGDNPKDLQQKVQGLIKKIGEPPLKAPDDQEGKILDDPKKGISWIVSGPVLRFNGFI